MRNLQLNIPQIVLIGATRGMIGVGVGLLLADQLKRDRRKSVGWVLLSIGALSTIPLALKIFRRSDGEPRRTAIMSD